ncbi:MAG: hypothetical protein LBI88_04310 [Deltaproteobacteria bacterium]|jgi:hypothetical protein|nr:hypothetical protein [Deltaproteobacteria bacterium]
MTRNYGVMGGLLLVCILLLGMPQPVSAALFGKSIFSDISNAMDAADHARDRYHQHRRDRDAGRYEREWIDREHKLEQTRIERMSREAKISPHEVRKMRENGRNWKDISDRYRVDSRKMGCSHKGPHGYDRDQDSDLYRHLYKKHPGKGRR